MTMGSVLTSHRPLVMRNPIAQAGYPLSLNECCKAVVKPLSRVRDDLPGSCVRQAGDMVKPESAEAFDMIAQATDQLHVQRAPCFVLSKSLQDNDMSGDAGVLATVVNDIGRDFESGSQNDRFVGLVVWLGKLLDGKWVYLFARSAAFLRQWVEFWGWAFRFVVSVVMFRSSVSDGDVMNRLIGILRRDRVGHWRCMSLQSISFFHFKRRDDEQNCSQNQNDSHGEPLCVVAVPQGNRGMLSREQGNRLETPKPPARLKFWLCDPVADYLANAHLHALGAPEENDPGFVLPLRGGDAVTGVTRPPAGLVGAPAASRRRRDGQRARWARAAAEGDCA